MAKAIPIADAAKAELHAPLQTKVASVILTVIYAVILLELWLNENHTPSFPILFGLSLIGFFLFLFLCIGVSFIWYLADDDGIRRHNNIFRPNLFVRWEDIERIEKTNWAQTKAIYNLILWGGKDEIRIAKSMIGMPAFIDLAKKHLPWEKWATAFGE